MDGILDYYTQNKGVQSMAKNEQTYICMDHMVETLESLVLRLENLVENLVETQEEEKENKEEPIVMYSQ